MTLVTTLLVASVIVPFAGTGSKAALTSSDGETTVVKKVSFRRRRRGILGNPWIPTVGAACSYRIHCDRTAVPDGMLPWTWCTFALREGDVVGFDVQRKTR